MDAMPEITDHGTDYVSFQNAALGAYHQGYFIQVVSVSDGTVVDIPEVSVSVVLDAGEFETVPFESSNTSTKVTCSNPCLVVQYGAEAWMSNMWGGPYMITLNPNMLLAKDLIFTTPRSSMDSEVTTLYGAGRRGG